MSRKASPPTPIVTDDDGTRQAVAALLAAHPRPWQVATRPSGLVVVLDATDQGVMVFPRGNTVEAVVFTLAVNRAFADGHP